MDTFMFNRYLILVLKRFILFKEGPRFKLLKLHTDINYDFAMDMSQFCEEENSFLMKAIVSHLGVTMSSGHYVCTSLNTEGVWVKHNDDRRSTVDKVQVTNLEARKQEYILTYEHSDNNY